MSDRERVPPGIDPNVPSVARMYDYYLGGKDNYEADREAAEKVIAISVRSGSDIRTAARDNRGFLGRAVRTLAKAGIRQFLDIGTGLPTQENVHEVALHAAPDARIVYVDNDPIVLIHARALLADNPQTAVVEADLLDPDGIIGHPELRDRIDFAEPVAVIFCAILQFVPDDADATRIVARFRDRLVPGSALVISHPFPGENRDELLGEVSQVYTKTRTGSFTLRRREQIEGFFEGTDLLEPGLVPVKSWRHGDGLRADFRPDYITPSYLGGVGRVP